MNRVSIGSDNGLLPIRHQTIICTNAGGLSIEPLGTNVSEILFKILHFSFTKMHFKLCLQKYIFHLCIHDILRIYEILTTPVNTSSAIFIMIQASIILTKYSFIQCEEFLFYYLHFFFF